MMQTIYIQSCRLSTSMTMPGKPTVEPVPNRLGLLAAWLPRAAVALVFLSPPASW